MLPLSLLQQAKGMAINYHNAPLPKYAGLHAPSWAILNNEKFHGVTWHEMVEEIDAGDILKQALIEIDPNETGLSLSVKCYQNAVNTFNELTYEISYQNTHKVAQNLINRTYFDYYKKPLHGGWINWNDSGEQIDRLCRALDLGHHHSNRLGLPKFNIGNSFFIIGQLKLLDKQSIDLPGTIIKIAPDFWQIATKTQVVQLEQVIPLTNKSFIDFCNLAQQYNIEEGSILASESEKNLYEYKSFYEVYAIHELFWVHQKEHFNPALLPFQAISTKCNDKQLTCVATLDLAHMFAFPSDAYPNNPPNLLFASLLVYLYRLGNKEHFGVGFSNPKLHQLPKTIAPLFSTVLPFFTANVR
nr:formyltransferase family protein [Legionella tunisiensis]